MERFFLALIDVLCAGVIGYAVCDTINTGKYGIAAGLAIFNILFALWQIQRAVEKKAA